MSVDVDDRNCWHVISEAMLLGALRRVAAGEDPDLVYAEMFANGDHEQH